MAEELRRAGAQVTDVTAYRTILSVPEREGEPDIYRLLLDRQIDIVTFTSASTVRNFVRVIGEDQAADLLQQTTVACIGPVTAEAAAQLGISTTIMPDEYTVPALRIIADDDLERWHRYPECVADQPDTPIDDEIEGDLLQFSSGTTG